MFFVCVCVCVCVFVCVCVLGSMCLTFFLLRDLFFTCFASFFYLVIHSILFHYIHALIWISLYPLDHLWLFLCFSGEAFQLLIPFVNHDKKGEKLWKICGFFFKILHVMGKNTCLCKGEMCFILLGGMLTSLFLYFGSYDHYWHTLYLSSLYVDVCLLHLPLHVLFLFSLYTHVYLFICNLLFLSLTKMPWWVLFKVFQKYKLLKSTCHKLSSCKVFQEFVLG